MVKFGKWLGGGLGWAIGGPIGGLIGLVIGSLLDNSTVITKYEGTGAGPSLHTTPGDFAVSLLILSAAVMKSDGKTMRSELDYVKNFLVRQYGEAAAKEQLKLLGEILKKDIPLHDVCMQIRQHMPISARLQLLHYLFGISKADGEVSESEIKVIEQIASYLNISLADRDSIRAMYYRDTTSDYRILEIEPSASDDELKKAYRKMAMKFHPDKVSGMGEGVQKSAEEKFKKVQEAYENIKKKRKIG
ncbi:MAG: TerB family tellurite resistance protein [Bacteroidia bacterium]